MGLFDVFKISSGLDRGLRSRGIEPRSLPPRLLSQLGSYVNQSYSRSTFKSEGHLLGEISVAAQYAACCILGPTAFQRAGGDETYCDIQWIAEAWKSRGPDANLQTAIVRAVNEAGMMSAEFAKIFKSHLEER